MRAVVLVTVFAASLGAATLFACSSGSTGTTSGGLDDGGTSGSDGSSGSSGGTSGTSGGTSGTSGTSGGTSGTSGGTSGTSGGTGCNTLAQQGANVDLIGTKIAAPAAAGGTIADGTYVLTGAKEHYAGLTEGATLSTLGPVTFAIMGTTANTITADKTGANVDHTTVTFAASGTSLTVTTTCSNPVPDGGLPAPSMSTYTATGTSFTQYTTTGATTFEFVFTKK
jgi:hypothetical protein